MNLLPNLPSLIRTYVPIAVGFILTWVATNLHIVLDPSSQGYLVALSVALVSAAYYWLARVLEKRFPNNPILNKLLGSSAQPTYTAPVAAVDENDENVAAVNAVLDS